MSQPTQLNHLIDLKIFSAINCCLFSIHLYVRRNSICWDIILCWETTTITITARESWKDVCLMPQKCTFTSFFSLCCFGYWTSIPHELHTLQCTQWFFHPSSNHFIFPDTHCECFRQASCTLQSILQSMVLQSNNSLYTSYKLLQSLSQSNNSLYTYISFSSPSHLVPSFHFSPHHYQASTSHFQLSHFSNTSKAIMNSSWKSQNLFSTKVHLANALITTVYFGSIR